MIIGKPSKAALFALTVVAFLVMGVGYVSAARTTVSATVNGISAVTVLPGTTVTISVTGTLTNNDDWHSTGYAFGTSTPSAFGYTCQNTNDHNGNGTYTEAFTVTAPSGTAAYNLYLRISGSNSDCDGETGSVLALTNAVTVIKPDLTVVASNNLSGGNATTSIAFNWVFTVTSASATSTFGNGSSGDRVFQVDLPTAGASYGTITAVKGSGVTGTVSCSIVSNQLQCNSGNGTNKLIIPGGGTVTVTVPTTPTASGSLAVPRTNGSCTVDVNNTVSEGNESNNNCSNSVTAITTGGLVVTKTTLGGDGVFSMNGLPSIGAFTMTTLNGSTTKSFSNLTPGSYTITETVPNGWTQTSNTCTVAVSAAATSTCVIVNTKLGSLSFTKSTTGGDATFSFSGSGSIGVFTLATVNGVGTKSFSNLLPATYSIAETVPGGWDKGTDTCASVSLTAGGSASCSIANTKRGSITVHESVVAPGGSDVSDSHTFTIKRDGSYSQSVTDGNTVVYSDLLPGTYTITQSTDTAYTLSSIATDNDTDLLNGAVVTVVAGTNVDVMFTTAQKQAKITVVTNVTNHGIGTNVPADFQIGVSGTNASPASFSGSGDGVEVNVDPGSFGVSVTAPSGYALTQSGTCAGSLTSNQTGTCTLSYSDIPTGQGAITVIKSVLNDNGGTKSASDFSLRLTYMSSIFMPGMGITGMMGMPAIDPNITFSFPVTLSVTSGAATDLAPNTYTVSESSNEFNYSQTGINCTDGESNTSGTVVLTAQAAWVCTVTNTDNAPSLTLTASVTTDNGGTATASDWTVTATGPTTISGDGTVSSGATLKAGTYTLSQTAGPEGYTAGSWSCTGATVNEDNQITVNLGDSVSCSIANDDQPAHLTIVKKTDGGEGTFNFSVSEVREIERDAIGGTNVELTTVNGSSTSDVKDLDAGNYNVTETLPQGWNFAGVDCIYDGKSVGRSIEQGEFVSVDNGDSVTCTFSNTKKAVLTVTKIVINDNSGTKQASDFSFSLNGDEAITFSEGGSNNLVLDPGTYSVTETSAEGYVATLRGCSGVTLAAGGTATCTITNDDNAPAPATNGGGSNGPIAGSFGGGNNGTGAVLGVSTTTVSGQVLGNSTTTAACSDRLITDYMRRGLHNNPAQVKLLQSFLNTEMSLSIPVSGFFGQQTEAGVNAFQKKHATDILTPWKIVDPTGYVFKTTLWKINMIHCTDLKTPQPIVS